MRNKVKFIIKLLLEILTTLLLSIKAVAKFLGNLFTGKYHKFPNYKKEREVFILGNGPSLNDINLKKLEKKNCDVICVNYFPSKNKAFSTLKPKYLCLFDPGYFDFVIKEERYDFEEFLDTLGNVDWPLTVICPVGKKLKIDNPNISYFWVNSCTNDSRYVNDFFYAFYKSNMMNYGFQNVVLGALYYCINVNYKKVYLAGVDMSDFKNLYVDSNNRVYVTSSHSYGSQKYYFDEMPEYGLLEFHSILLAYQKMFDQFNKAKEYALKLNVNIENLSIDSYIDSFDKVEPTKLDFGNDKVVDINY